MRRLGEMPPPGYPGAGQRLARTPAVLPQQMLLASERELREVSLSSKNMRYSSPR
jgi:hypothetical protein